jgi:replication factor A1
MRKTAEDSQRQVQRVSREEKKRRREEEKKKRRKERARESVQGTTPHHTIAHTAMDQLRPDSLFDIFRKNDTASPVKVCAYQAKTLTDQALPRVRMLITDGRWSLNAVYKPSSETAKNQLQGFQKFSILKLNEFSISYVGAKYFMVVSDCEILGVADRIESPNFTSIDAYFREHPDENAFQKNLDLITASNGAATTTETTTAPSVAIAQKSVSPSPPIVKKQQTSSSSSSSSSSKFAHPPRPIDQLSPYVADWAIKARVSYKSDMKTWNNARGGGKLFSVHFMDETSEIKATAFNDAADKFFDILQENKAYYIFRGTLKKANRDFNKLKSDLEIGIEKYTEIQPIDDDDDDNSVPKLSFDFVKLDQIPNIENNQVVDVLGIVKHVDDKREIVSKTSGKPYDRRDITIVDQTQMAVNVGLWNKQAREFNLDVGTPVAIKGCKINDFQGKQLSLIPSAVIFANPNIPEAYKLKGWYDNEGSTESYQNLRSSTASGSGGASLTSKEAALERISVAQAHETKLGFSEKPDYLSIKASVSFIKPDNFSYPACSSDNCSKKVIEQSDGTWRCERCNINHPEPLHRYILTAAVVDETGQMWLNLFNEQAEQLIGCDANTLLNIKATTDDSLRKYLTEKVLFKEYAFRIRAKLDSYQGVDRARFQVLSLGEIDPASEAEALAEIIDKLSV